MDSVCQEQAGEFDYQQWNADVAKELREALPDLSVEYFTQLGGGCQAVAFGMPNDNRTTVITDDCICVYPVPLAALWATDDEVEATTTVFPDELLSPVHAALLGVIHHIAASVSVDADRLGELATTEWTDKWPDEAAKLYPGIYTWLYGSSYMYYIERTIKAAIMADAPKTAIYDGGKYFGWVCAETITALSTARSLLRRMRRLLAM